jgi:DNA polymerase-3 subunit gamma/tau
MPNEHGEPHQAAGRSAQPAAAASVGSAAAPTASSVDSAAADRAAVDRAAVDPAVAQAAAFAAAAAAKKGSNGAAASELPAGAGSAASSWATPGVTDDRAAPVVGPVTTQQLKDAWPEVLEHVAEASRNAWAVVYTATVRALDGDVLSLSFPSANDVESFRGTPGSKDAASEVLRQAIVDLLGVKVKFVAKPAGGGGGAGGPGAGGPVGDGPAQGGGAQSVPAPGGSPQRVPVDDGGAQPGAARDDDPQGGRAGVSGRAEVSTGRTPAPVSQRASASAVGWETVAIPGAATAVLERPHEDTAASAPTPTAAVQAPSAPPASPASPAPSAPSASSTPAPVPPTVPGTDDEGWYVGPDAPDDEEPPYPDDDTASVPADVSPAAAAPATDRRSNADRQSNPDGRSNPDRQSNADGQSNPDRPAEPESNPGRRQERGNPPSRPKASVGFAAPSRYGEAVVRELLGAKFIEEQQVEARGQSQSGWAR